MLIQLCLAFVQLGSFQLSEDTLHDIIGQHRLHSVGDDATWSPRRYTSVDEIRDCLLHAARPMFVLQFQMKIKIQTYVGTAFYRIYFYMRHLRNSSLRALCRALWLIWINATSEDCRRLERVFIRAASQIHAQCLCLNVKWKFTANFAIRRSINQDGVANKCPVFALQCQMKG